MDTTRASLILRIRDPNNSLAWREFYELYGPLIYRYGRAKGLSAEDAEDIRSQCMEAVVQQIGSFEYDKAKGGFKNWLRRLVHNKTVDLIRKRREKQADTQEMRAVVDGNPSPDEEWEKNWKKSHLRYCVEQIRKSLSENNFKAFWMLVFDERPVEEVCSILGMNANQVYKAKSNTLARLRDMMAEFDL